MPFATIPSLVTDADRLKALAGYGILDTPAEAGFDDIVHLACRLCATPVALVSLVAGDRQWFKARVGFPACETDLNSSVCAHALAQPDELLIIPDLTLDPRTAANPLVTGEPFIRFYAGAPLRTPKGLVLGSLCVIDAAPRPEGLTEAQAGDLRALSRQVMTQLEMRRVIAARDDMRAAEVQAYRGRDALRDTQAAIALADGDRDAMLDAVVEGALRAIPAAEGGTIQLIVGGALEYRAVRGTLHAHRGARVALQDGVAGQCARTGQPFRTLDALSDRDIERDEVERLDLRAAVVAPILRGNTVLGVLKLQSGKVAAFSEQDLEQARLFAGAATAGLAEAEARQLVRVSNLYWRGLFDRLSEGFIVGQVVRDAHGRVSDWRYLEANPAWGALVGVDSTTVAGRTIREVFPGIEDEWVGEFAQVVETGEPHAFTRQVSQLRRWQEGRAFRLDQDRFGVIFLDVTARWESEQRRNALLTLGDTMRDLNSVGELARAASEIVGRTLGVTRSGYGQIDAELEHIEIQPDWTAPGTPSIAGRHRFADYGDIREHLLRGEALIIEDVSTDARTRDDPSALLALGVVAQVNMPVRERGRTIAVFIVHDDKPRVWSQEECAFLRNVADRVEAGVARLHAEEQQQVLNQELAHRLKNTLAIVQSIGKQTLRGVSERHLVEAFDQRVLALSRAHDVLLQTSWSAARMRSVMESVLTIQADLDRFALEGPDMDISPQAALSLSLLLHEMATNALKYGALSMDAGRIQLTWRIEHEIPAMVVLDWTEHGGPAVGAVTGQAGFGSRLIRMGLMGTRDTNLRYDPKGLRAEFRAPLSEIQAR